MSGALNWSGIVLYGRELGTFFIAPKVGLAASVSASILAEVVDVAGVLARDERGQRRGDAGDHGAVASQGRRG